MASAYPVHVPLHRYWHPTISDHFYTTSAAEIGTTSPGSTGRHGYVSEGITGYVATAPGTVHKFGSEADK